jgi:hypothetical protein
MGGRCRQRMAHMALMLVLSLSVAACTPAEEPAARAAGERFQAAVDSHDGDAACQLLSDEARSNLESGSRMACAQAISRLQLPAGGPQSIQVWGGNAQVRFDTGVMFLAQFKAGWKITGAGCRPRPNQPYDCDIEG